jgi:hypothetical protein
MRTAGESTGATPGPGKRSAAKAATIDPMTRIIAAHPQVSLIYRLRGNAYDNLGDRSMIPMLPTVVGVSPK